MRGRNHARVRNDDDANARERSREAPNEASQPPADASVARRAPSNTPPSHRIAKVTHRNERGAVHRNTHVELIFTSLRDGE